jgi:hypothetical protein
MTYIELENNLQQVVRNAKFGVGPVTILDGETFKQHNPPKNSIGFVARREPQLAYVNQDEPLLHGCPHRLDQVVVHEYLEFGNLYQEFEILGITSGIKGFRTHDPIFGSAAIAGPFLLSINNVVNDLLFNSSSYRWYFGIGDGEPPESPSIKKRLFLRVLKAAEQNGVLKTEYKDAQFIGNIFYAGDDVLIARVAILSLSENPTIIDRARILWRDYGVNSGDFFNDIQNMLMYYADKLTRMLKQIAESDSDKGEENIDEIIQLCITKILTPPDLYSRSTKQKGEPPDHIKQLREQHVLLSLKCATNDLLTPRNE